MEQKQAQAAEASSDRAQDENKLIAQRKEKLNAVRATRNAFPNDFRRDSLASELAAAHGDTSREELAALQKRVIVAGRLIRMRGPFLVIQDVSGQLQLYFNHKEVGDAVNTEIKLLDLGDITPWGMIQELIGAEAAQVEDLRADIAALGVHIGRAGAGAEAGQLVQRVGDVGLEHEARGGAGRGVEPGGARPRRAPGGSAPPRRRSGSRRHPARTPRPGS